MMEKTADELPAAVGEAIDEKHQGELEDLLMRLYEERAGELRDLVGAWLEEKAQGQAVIAENYRARTAAVDALIAALDPKGREADGAAKKTLMESKDKLAEEEQRELHELDKDIQVRKSEAERGLQSKALAREAEQV